MPPTDNRHHATIASNPGPTAPDPAIEVRDVARIYTATRGRHGHPARHALADIDLTVSQAEFVAVIGTSGCGKSTLLRIIGGMDAPTSGTVQLDGRPPDELRAAGDVGFVPQSPALLPWQTAAENVGLLDRIGRRHRQLTRGDIERWLDRVELAGEAHLLPHELSGGMQQRVALARAFALEPAVLLLDEPFSALDEVSRLHMHELLLRLLAETTPTVVFVTHSIDEAVKLADRVVILGGSPGRVVSQIDIDLSRPRSLGIEDTIEFRHLTAQVRKELVALDPTRTTSG